MSPFDDDDDDLFDDDLPGNYHAEEDIFRKDLIDADIDRHCRARADQDRVAVRDRVGDIGGADDGGRAEPGLHHHALSQTLLEVMRNGARDHVGIAAGGIGQDQRDRLGRIILRSCQCRRERSDAAGKRQPRQ